MKILFVTHYLRENLGKFRGSIPIISQLLEKNGNEIIHIANKEWLSFFKIYLAFKPDVIITCGTIGGIIGILNKFGLIKAKLVHHWGDNYIETMGEKWGSNLIGFLEKSAVKNSDTVITIAKSRVEKGGKWGKICGKNLFYLPLGYNPDFMKKLKKTK